MRHSKNLTLELSQCRKSGSIFSVSKPVGEAVTASSNWQLPPTWKLSWKLPVFVLARPTAQAVPSSPKSLAIDITPTPLITIWNSLWRDCQQGLKLGLKLELSRLTNEL